MRYYCDNWEKFYKELLVRTGYAAEFNNYLLSQEQA